MTLLACLELQDFGEVVILVTGAKQSQLLVFWTWLGLEVDKRGSPGKTTEVKEGGKVFHPSGNTGILKNFFTFLFRKSIDFKLIELLISNFLNKIHSPQVFI